MVISRRYFIELRPFPVVIGLPGHFGDAQKPLPVGSGLGLSSVGAAGVPRVVVPSQRATLTSQSWHGKRFWARVTSSRFRAGAAETAILGHSPQPNSLAWAPSLPAPPLALGWASQGLPFLTPKGAEPQGYSQHPCFSMHSFQGVSALLT